MTTKAMSCDFESCRTVDKDIRNKLAFVSVQHEGKCGVFSGSVVEISGHWFWLTAAHCFDEIETVLDFKGEVTAEFITLADTTIALPFVFRRDDQLHFGKFARTSDISGVSGKEYVDVGFLKLDDLVVCYLLQQGVVPWHGDELRLTELYASSLENSAQAGPQLPELWSVGVPASSVLQSGEMIDVKVAQIPLSFEDLSHPTELKPFMAWLFANHRESTIGMSGGPIIARFGGKPYLVGIQSRQREHTDGFFIGINEVEAYIQLVSGAVEATLPGGPAYRYDI